MDDFDQCLKYDKNLDQNQFQAVNDNHFSIKMNYQPQRKVLL
jgi:hypothetical protein